MKAFALILILLATGCASARVEAENPGSNGIITYNPPRSTEGKQKAMLLAKENCGPKPVKVVSEGYKVVGSKTAGSESKYDKKSKSTSSTTTQVKEWRMKYKCAKR